MGKRSSRAKPPHNSWVGVITPTTFYRVGNYVFEEKFQEVWVDEIYWFRGKIAMFLSTHASMKLTWQNMLSIWSYLAHLSIIREFTSLISGMEGQCITKNWIYLVKIRLTWWVSRSRAWINMRWCWDAVLFVAIGFWITNENISLTEELYKSKGANSRRDTGVDVFHSDGAAKPKLYGMEGADDILDTQSESNPYVPNINSMQNTPFPNSPSKVPNQFIANNMKGPASLTSSSQNMNSSIMPPQQRLQEKVKQLNSVKPPPPGPPPNQMMGSHGHMPPQGPNPMAHQQILELLHREVNAGLISPELLNQQLPPPMLVLLQQLLHYEQLLKSLITTQHAVQQNKMNANPLVQRQQLEQVNLKVNFIKSQILQLAAANFWCSTLTYQTPS